MNSAIFYSDNTNPSDAKEVSRICGNLKLALIFENDFTNLLHKIMKTNPKFVFLDGNGEEIVYLSKLLTGEIYNKIKLIIVSDNFVCDNKFIKVVSLESLESHILNLNEYYNDLSVCDGTKCESKIKEILLNLGFSASSKGFDYIYECVYLSIENNHYKCLKQCFDIIKCNYEISNENNIDRDMRWAISNAFSLNKGTWNALFNNVFDKKPTCKNFICLLANKIKEEMMAEI